MTYCSCLIGVIRARTVRGRWGVHREAEVAALSQEGEQVLVGAGAAADPGEAVLQEPAGEKSVDDGGDDGAPRAVGGGEALVVDQAQVPETPVE